VIGFMSGNQQDPDLMCEVFIVAPTDLVDMPLFACSWQTQSGGAAWVQVAGELDIATSPQLRQTMEEAQRAEPSHR
jgi:hypothetical protein